MCCPISAAGAWLTSRPSTCGRSSSASGAAGSRRARSGIRRRRSERSTGAPCSSAWRGREPDTLSHSVRRAHAGDPGSAARMIGALEKRDQPVFALAFYAGLRLGELRALRWGDVDQAAGVTHVRRSWDPQGGRDSSKSFASTRDVPILAVLTPYSDAETRALLMVERSGWACARIERPHPVRLRRSLPAQRQSLGCRRARARDTAPSAALIRIVPHRRWRRRQGR